MGCKFLDLKCALKNTPLGPVAKQLEKPWQGATGIAASLLKGTPLEHIAAGVNLVSKGQMSQAASQGVTGIMDVVKAVVPGVAEVPGLGLLTDAASSLVGSALSPKKGAAQSQNLLAGALSLGSALGGAAGVPVPNLGAIIGPNSPLGPLLKTTAASVTQPVANRLPASAQNNVTAASFATATSAQDVVQGSAAVNMPAPPTVRLGGKRQPRKFTPDQWRAFAGNAATVGGTQPWAVE